MLTLRPKSSLTSRTSQSVGPEVHFHALENQLLASPEVVAKSGQAPLAKRHTRQPRSEQQVEHEEKRKAHAYGTRGSAWRELRIK